MSVTLTGTGGVFKKIGRLAGRAADIVALKGGSATTRVLSGSSMTTAGTNILADAAESPAVSAQAEGILSYIDSWRAAQNGLLQQLANIAAAETIRQVDLDASLSTKDITSALTELIRQMKANSDSINASTVAVGSQTSVGSPTGTPIVVGSKYRKDGYVLQTLFPETIRFTTTTDSQGSATARQESINVKGAAAVTDVFSHLWPGGSGCNVTLNLADAQLDNSGGNCLVNSDFETFTTSNVADNWVYASGAAGTDIYAAGSGYTQSNALKFTGDGSTTITIRQTFNQAVSTAVGLGGSPYKILPSTQYAINLWVKVLSSAPAAGVLRIRLVDS